MLHRQSTSSHFLHGYRKTKLAVALLAASLATGCAIQPKPFTNDELNGINQADRVAARDGMPAIEGPLSLEEAIARALKYNLDQRTRMLEQAQAAGQLDASRFDVLPRLLANAGYSSRDEESTRRSLNPNTNPPVISQIGFISSERNHATWDVGLTWNLLDFGASYYTANQNADRLLISEERRRKAMHNLMQNVRTAYWRAVAAEKLGDQVQASIREAESALADARRVGAERIKSPNESLRYQRNLLENLRLLENVERELASARIELAGLIGAIPGQRIVLAEPAQMTLKPLDLAAERMEEIALTQNADLREQFYNARIAATETRKSLLKLLPGLSFNYGINHDDDKYLINQQWQEAGAKVSFNLFNLLSGPSQMKAARMGVKVAETRRMALQMSVLTQVHLARFQYGDSLRQFERADAIHDIDAQLARHALNQEQSEMASRLDRISVQVSSILSTARRYQAMAKVQEAASRVQAILGMEPRIGSLDDITLPELSGQIRQYLTAGENTPTARSDVSPAKPVPLAPLAVIPAPYTSTAPTGIASEDHVATPAPPTVDTTARVIAGTSLSLRLTDSLHQTVRLAPEQAVAMVQPAQTWDARMILAQATLPGPFAGKE